MEQNIQHGRTCVRCGAKDYPLSTSGPNYCSACACGDDIGRIKALREENEMLRDILSKNDIEIAHPNSK